MGRFSSARSHPAGEPHGGAHLPGETVVLQLGCINAQTVPPLP